MKRSLLIVWMILGMALLFLALQWPGLVCGQPATKPKILLTNKPIHTVPKGASIPSNNLSGVSGQPGNALPNTMTRTPATVCTNLQFACPTILPPATVQVDYLYRFRASGGSAPLTFSLENAKLAPEGMRFKPDGTLQGRPTKEGEYLLLVLVQDRCPKGAQSVKKTFSLKIKPASLTRAILTRDQPPSLSGSKPEPGSPGTRPDLRVSSGVTILKPVPGQGAGEQDQDRAPHVQRQIVITLELEKGKVLIKQLQQKYGLELVESFMIKALKQMAVTFRTDQDLPALIGKIRGEPGVIVVQSNRVYGTLQEPKSDLQSVCRLLNFTALHKYRRGRGVTIALIDTGVDLNHRDLKKRIIFHQNYVSDSTYRAEIHGTAVAGIIAAEINNFGMEGIAPQANLMALRACEQVSEQDPLGHGSTISIIKALDAAIEKRAKIVNMSFGSPAPDPLIAHILEEGARQGILFTAPVGNRAGQSLPVFPASCPAVTAVGGLDQNNQPFPDESLSAFAKVAAPAENILVTVPGDKHNFMTGTSFSSAIVAGILALAVEKNRALDSQSLPEFPGELCAWTELLLGMKTVCLK